MGNFSKYRKEHQFLSIHFFMGGGVYEFVIGVINRQGMEQVRGTDR